MNFNQIKLASLTLPIIMLVSSCGGNKKSSEGSSEFETAKEQVAVDIAKVLQDIPPPSEVPYLLMNAGAEFNPNIINSIDKIESYQESKFKAALNLGIYAADIAYLTSYEKLDRSLDYMEGFQKLSSPAGISGEIDYGMIARFEVNMDNSDSLSQIINEAVAQSSEKLSEFEELNSAVMLLTGSWIEGVYISATIVNTYPNDLPKESRALILEPLIQIIIDQKKSLNDLLQVMNDVPDSEDINKIIADLEKVKTIYDNELTKVEKQITENTGDFVLTTSTLDNLTAEISRIRNAIIE